MNFDLKWIDNNVIVAFKGKVDFNDINDANTIIIGDSRFDDLEFEIFDFCNVEKFNLTEKDILMIAALDKSSSIWNKEIKGALVFADKTVYKLAKKYIELMKDTDWTIKIFYNIDDAIKWCSE